MRHWPAALVPAGLRVLLREGRRVHERSAEIAALISASEDAVIGTSPEGIITSWNRGAELIYGWSAAETVGNSLEMVVPEATRDAVADSHSKLRHGGVTVIRHQAQGLHRDGYVIDVALTVCPLFVGDRLVAVSTVARDISAAVKAEAERERLLAELAAQNEQLRELDRMKDEFVASVSHELRTPLTSIRGYLELLREDLEPDEQANEMLDIVDRNAGRLLALVNDLLFAAQVAAGKPLNLQLEVLDLAEIVLQAVTAAEPRAEHAGVAVETSVKALAIRADALRVAQVVDNLISNAIKFTPPGGTVRIDLVERGPRAVLTVADTGIGIPDEERDELFTRFYRARAANDGAIQGTGLGLAIAKSIVEAHGGAIGFTSEFGMGTTFEVDLPLASVGLAVLAHA
jgi:PAS domain S-box-containing protein